MPASEARGAIPDPVRRRKRQENRTGSAGCAGTEWAYLGEATPSPPILLGTPSPSSACSVHAKLGFCAGDPGAELGLGVPRGRAGARRSQGPSWGSAFPGAELGLGVPGGPSWGSAFPGAELGLGVPGEPSWGSAFPGAELGLGTPGVPDLTCLARYVAESRGIYNQALHERAVVSKRSFRKMRRNRMACCNNTCGRRGLLLR